MNAQENYAALKELALNQGMALFGVADIEPMRKDILIPEEVSAKFKYGISIGCRLSQSVLDTLADFPNQLYYFHYQRTNILLDQTVLKITSWIQKKGFHALPIPASQLVDWQKQLATVNHREVARRAGHGWYGRNNLMVNPDYGSQVRYSTVLTSIPLTVDKPIESGCESCVKCVSVCPAQAIKENEFTLQLCRDKLKEFVKTGKVGQNICGVCLKACSGASVLK